MGEVGTSTPPGGGGQAGARYRELLSKLRGLGSVLVAFSGGVDSTLLLCAARQALPRAEVLAVTAVSAVLPRHERDQAKTLAKDIGVEHLLVEGREMQDPHFTSNPPDKCYICKKGRYEHLLALAAEHGLRQVVDGENAEDHLDYRPGSRAARELGVRSPLSEAGLTKEQIREVSRHLGLPTWNKPSSACLASRIPYRQPITLRKLRQVDLGEAFLRRLGMTGQVRLRHHGDVARIELSARELPRLLEDGIREQVVAYLRSIGFAHVACDLEGYATGSLNRAVGGSR